MTGSKSSQRTSTAPSPVAFLRQLHALAESAISEAEIFDRTSNGTLHELFGVPKSAFELNEEISVYVPLEAQKPITSKDLLKIDDDDSLPVKSPKKFSIERRHSVTTTRRPGVTTDSHMARAPVVGMRRKTKVNAEFSEILTFGRNIPSNFFRSACPANSLR
jgi:hypothetical protein